jgi:4Fe-4S single cluster domain of Ferredoxin I
MDPQTYGRVGSMSAVVRQPETPDERRKALQALLACPTHSIQVKHQVCYRRPDLAPLYNVPSARRLPCFSVN